MTRYYVEYSVPVVAIVEGDGVVRVVVCDEEVQETETPVYGVNGHGDQFTAGSSEATVARDVAERSEWPAWSFGW